MAKYRIRILKAASQDLERLDKPTARRTVQRINWMAVNLDGIRLEALVGDLAGLYKLRVGDYRVIYEVLSGCCTSLFYLRNRDFHRPEDAEDTEGRMETLMVYLSDLCALCGKRLESTVRA